MIGSVPEGPRYSFGICGSTGPDPRYNPGDVLREPTARAIVCALNQGPLTKLELAEGLARKAASQGLPTPTPEDLHDALARVVALRAVEERADGRWHITFPLLTAADQEELAINLAPFAASLGRDVLDARPAVDAALEQVAWERPLPEIRLAVVGCMALDWAALTRFERQGLIHPGISYPDGGKFTILGSETTGRGGRPAKLYCSSHSAEGERYAFTGFGENAGPRYGLPDALWRLKLTGAEPGEILEALGRFARSQAAGLVDVVGEALAAVDGRLEAGSKQGGGHADGGAAVRLLEALGYVAGGNQHQSGQRRIQLFRAEHWPAVRGAVEVVMAVVDPWIAANYQGVVQAVRGTSPARNGVDPATFFVEIWHDLFGVANRLMAEEGWLFDPPPPRPGEARHMTWCSEVALNSLLREWLHGGA